MAQWLDVGARDSGMPIDARLWSTNPIASTYPACQAVKAAAEQGPDAAYRYLRRLREGLMTERKKLDHAEALVGEAGPAGLNVDRFRIDLASNAITEAFAADLDEVRAPPRRRGRQGRVSETEGRERITFPSAVFRGEDGDDHGVFGPQPYEAYRDAALAAGAEPMRTEPPEPRGGDRPVRPLRDAGARGADRKAAPGARGGAVGARARLEAPPGRRAGRDLLGARLALAGADQVDQFGWRLGR